MHALDDVAALAELAQDALRLGPDEPLRMADLSRDTENFQRPQPADLQRVELVRLAVGARREIDDAGLAGVADKLAVELRPAFGLDLAFESTADIEIGARSQLLGDELARPVAHALLDVVARDHEVLAIVPHAAHDQVDMRMLGVPVIDGDPVELRAEIFFHLADEIAGEGSKVRHVGGVVGRDDEAEMMPVIATALCEGAGVGILRSRPEQPRLLPVTGHAVAAQIVEMRSERRGSSGVTDHTRLDDGATRARRDEAISLNAGALATPEA